MREFGIIQDKFPGSEDVYKNWADASVANLSDVQREKLFGILNPKPEEPVVSDNSTSEVDSVDHISISGDVTDVWNNIPEDKRGNIERSIQYVLEKWYKWDLLVGKWVQDAPIGMGFQPRIWGHISLDSYNFIEQWKSVPNTDPNKNEYLLLLRVKPDVSSSQKATLTPHLLEIPGNSNLVKFGFAFWKDLTPQEFLDYLITSKPNIAKAA